MSGRIPSTVRRPDSGWRGHSPHAVGKIVGRTEGVNLSAEPVRIEVVASSTSAARQVLRTYVDDVASSYYGRPATDEEIDAALRGPQYRPRAAVRRVPRCPSARRGPGLRGPPLAAGEGRRGQTCLRGSSRPRSRARRPTYGRAGHLAREHGLSALRLDTRHDLVEARRLYAALGR